MDLIRSLRLLIKKKKKKWQKNKTCLSSSNGCRAALSVDSSILKKIRQVHRKFTSAFLSYDNPFMSVSQPPTASQQQKGSALHTECVHQTSSIFNAAAFSLETLIFSLIYAKIHNIINFFFVLY